MQTKDMALQDLMGFHPIVNLDVPIANAIKGSPDAYPMIDNDTYVGIEVEVERILTNSNVLSLEHEGERYYLWGNKEDGSLRNNGREFVSYPIKGEQIPFALNVLHKKLTKDKSCIGHEFTNRTSVHVHVNVRDCTIEQICNIILTYIVLEPVIYNFCGGKRHKNIYCVPLNQTSLDEAVGHIFKMDRRATEYMYTLWKKYTGFNLRPIRNLGTIEFRHMVGTIDVDRLTTWINILLSLKKFACSMSHESLRKLALSLNTTSEYAAFLREATGDYADILMMDCLHEKMEDTVTFVKDCLSETSEHSVIKLFSMNGMFTEKAKETKWIKNLTSSGLISSIKDIKKKVLKSRGTYATTEPFGGAAVPEPVPARAAAPRNAAEWEGLRARAREVIANDRAVGVERELRAFAQRQVAPPGHRINDWQPRPDDVEEEDF